MLTRRCPCRLFLAVFVVHSAVFALHAQPKPSYLPTATHVYPAGARRGTVVDVFVGGECLPPGSRFSVFGKGVRVVAPKGRGNSLPGHATTSMQRLTKPVFSAGEPSPRRNPTEEPITYPKEWASRISVDRSANPGVVRWRVSCAQGGTVSHPFVIGDLPEFLETESNSTFDAANSITLPVTVNGRIHGERDLDHFRFSAKPGDVVVCEVLAWRLRSRLDPVITILDAAGQPIATETTYVGNDPVVAFRADSAGDYVLRIANVSHRGDPAHVYRVNISTKPFVRSAFPAGGQAGTQHTVEFRELSGTSKPRIVRRTIRFPKSAKIASESPGPWFSAVHFAASPHQNLIEREPNQTPDSAMTLTLPVSIDGRTQARDDQDWFTFRAKKGIRYLLDCRTGIGSRAFPTLLINDAQGKQIAFARSIESENRTCRIEWQATADQSVHVRIRDQQFGAAGGAEFTYRLTVRETAADYELSVDSDSVNVVQGSDTRITIAVKRVGGFAEPVTISVEGLPKGLTAKSVEVGVKKQTATISISAADTVASGDAEIRVVARTKNGKPRTARLRINGSLADSRTGLHLTVLHKPVFRLFCSEAYLYAHRGSVFMYPMEIERLNGFKGKITLQIGDRQNRDLDGIEMFEVTAPRGKSEIALPIYLPETMHINIQSQSQLYCQAFATFTDKLGRRQSVLVLSEKRNMLRTLPPVVKLNSVTKRTTAKPGETIRCRLKLERTSNFRGPMTVELLSGTNAVDFTAAPATIAAGKSDVVVSMRIPRNAGRTARLQFRATGKMTDGTTIITEAIVELRIR